MGREILITLKPIEQSFGIGGDITALTIAIKLAHPELIQETSPVLLRAAFTVVGQPEPYVVTQVISSATIVDGIIPLEGTLWVLGRPDDIKLTSEEVTIYYISKEE